MHFHWYKYVMTHLVHCVEYFWASFVKIFLLCNETNFAFSELYLLLDVIKHVEHKT